MAILNFKQLNNNLPKHIGIIMDGNGRWATKRGLPRSMGHKAGIQAFRRTVEYCRELEISIVTVYAFSTENWKRPPEEIEAIMNLLREYLSETEKHQEENIRTCFIGDIDPLAPDIQQRILQLQQDTAKNDGITINIALNYGGRAEIVQGVQQLAQRVRKGNLAPEDITEEILSRTLYTAGQPDPDLIIRPSGEQRLSNFLIWQTAYAEYVFMDVLWPDFGKKHLIKALAEYQKRNRRFGGL